MSIIAYKNNIINPVFFLEEVKKQPFIDGLFLELTMTKDGVIIAFNSISTANNSLETLQNSKYSEIKDSSIVELDEALAFLKQLKKRIVFSVAPLLIPIPTDETIQQFNAIHEEYIKKINATLSHYLDMPISLHSINNHVVFFLKREISNFPIGLEVSQENLNYMDVDYYVLPPSLLNETIIKQQINLGKEIMISAITGNDMAIVYYFFEQNPSLYQPTIFSHITFICSYPKMVFSLFQQKFLNQ